jgi:hypothetical protein
MKRQKQNRHANQISNEGKHLGQTRSKQQNYALPCKAKIRDFSLKIKRADVSCICLAHKIVEYAHETCRALLTAAELPSLKEGDDKSFREDILRSIIVMAGSGLDATLKQILRDSLPELIKYDSGVRREFAAFISKKLKKMCETMDNSLFEIFGTALADDSPRNKLLDEYQKELLRGSLQSAEQIDKLCSVLGMNNCNAGVDREKLKEIFNARNQIVHDFDIDVSNEKMPRHKRNAEDIINYTNTLLEVAECFLKRIDEKFVEIFPDVTERDCSACGSTSYKNKLSQEEDDDHIPMPPFNDND